MATNMSNIVKCKELREAQLNTLEKIASTVGETAGPAGSYTMVIKDGIANAFTKDGHKVLSAIQFFHPLERCIMEEIQDATAYIAKTVGDGTTAMTKLSYYVFDELCKYESSHPEIPRYKIINSLKEAIDAVQKKILENKKEMVLSDIYKICMISTDGNKEVSETIANIYKDYGSDVFIDLSISSTEDHIIKKTDGMTIQRGYPSPAYINTQKGNCVINSPRLYCFTDPVDTPEMINLFGKIIYQNITEPMMKRGKFTPTVIICPSISRDMTKTMSDVESLMYGFQNIEDKPPLLIITGFSLDLDFYGDLMQLTGSPAIKKYINPDIQQKAIEDGDAPSIETVVQFYGTCDQIVCDNNTTCFINPKYMYDETENGEKVLGNKYTQLINFLNSELKHSEENNDSVGTINNIKRRLHSLQSNYVEYMIGGIASGDRNSVKDLAEDAILSCRSAALHGVGRGANFEGLLACQGLVTESIMNDTRDVKSNMYTLLYRAFYNSVLSLYKSVFGDKAYEILEYDCSIKEPINLRTLEYNHDVLCSIETDRAILEAISRIETMMFNTTQSLLNRPTDNIYLDIDEKE